MRAHLTASLLLNNERAVVRVHRYEPSADMVRLGSRQGCDITALHVEGLTLQWDSVDQARAFLANASAALEAEAARYLAEQGQA